jgi:hypothetical protein
MPTPQPDPTAQPPNFGVGDTYSWVKVRGLESFREMYARATYVTNLKDLTVSMSATDVRIGGVEIVDNDSGLRCDVTSFEYEDGSYNALRVVTQDLEPIYDGVSLGDIEGNMVGVNASTSSLFVDVTNLNSLTAITQNEFDQTQTLLNTLTSLAYNEVTLLNALTARELTINFDTSAININTDEIENLIRNSNTLLNSISGLEQIQVTHLNTLTANSVYGTNSNTPEFSYVVNFNSLSSVIQSGTIISLLNALTAREYDININAGDINLNTDEIEGQLRQTATFLNVLTANSVYGTSSAIPLHITGNTTIINETTGTGVNVSFADSPNLDAFGRLRVSEPRTLLDAKHLYDKLPLVFNETLSGTATSTFSANDSMVVMSTRQRNDIVIRQTKHHFNYQPGKSIQAFFTGKMHPEEGIIKRAGLFQSLSSIPYHPSDGMYLEVTTTEPSFNIVKDGQVTSIPRSQWNVDRLDGTGHSRCTVDFTAAQIFIIDYEWLGLGRVRFGFMQAGKVYYAHYVEHKNSLDRPYITSPNQPVRYEIRQIGNTSGTMHHICSTVMIEGGEEDVGKPIAVVNNKVTEIDTNYHALVAIKLKESAHDSSVVLKAVEVLNANSSNPGMYDVIVNPSSVTPPFIWSDISNTAIQHAINITAPVIVSGGYSLFKGFAPTGVGGTSTAGGQTVLGEITKLGINIDNTPDVIVLAGKAFADNQKVDLIGIMKLLERS